MNSFDYMKSNLSDDQIARLRNTYSEKFAVVTGGLSFIGSHLVEALVAFGCKVRILDDFSSGKAKNLSSLGNVEVVNMDLRNRVGLDSHFAGSDYVFHLAAVHGGRGFIERYQKQMLANMAIDNFVFAAAVSSGVKAIIHASSACAYPVNLQFSETDLNLLREDQASMEFSEGCFADGVYGWTKLMGEYQLKNYVQGTATKGRSARIFTAYGERENESHAAIALIAKSLLHADPFPIWGSGQQTRNFTYVSDTVTGLLFLGTDDGDLEFDVFNVGTSHHVKVIDFAKTIFELVRWEPTSLNLQLDKPTGVASRASNNTKTLEKFGWQPNVGIREGLQRTINWYESSGLLPHSLDLLEQRLLAR